MAEQLVVGMFPIETPEEAEKSCRAMPDPFAALLGNYKLLHALAMELARERNRLETQTP